MSPRRIVLLRHGQTADNARGVIQGQLDVPLDDVGRAQAAVVAPVLAGLAPYAVVASDLVRAQDTAGPLAALAGLPVTLDPRLRELDLGTWQGLTSEQARDLHPDEHASWAAGVDVPRGGGETYADAGARAAQCLLEWAPPSGQVLVAVTHGGTARAALGALLELPADAGWRLTGLGNCCWSVLVEARRGWRLERHGVQVGDPAGPPPGGQELGGRADAGGADAEVPGAEVPGAEVPGAVAAGSAHPDRGAQPAGRLL